MATSEHDLNGQFKIMSCWGLMVDRPLAKDTALPPRYSKFNGF